MEAAGAVQTWQAAQSLSGHMVDGSTPAQTAYKPHRAQGTSAVGFVIYTRRELSMSICVRCSLKMTLERRSSIGFD